MRLFNGFIALMMLLLPPMAAFAGGQRMGIAPGAYNLAANASSNIPAFCFDLSRDSPNAGSNYSTVLTSVNDATVAIGSQTMSVQQAIDQHLIAIKGIQPTFNDVIIAESDPHYLKHLSKSRRDEAIEEVAAWNDASDTEKEQVEKHYAAEFAQIGNHTQLQFVNLANEPVRIDVSKPVVFGQKSDIGVPLDIPAIATNLSQRDEQDEIWMVNTKVQQGELIQAGYLPAKSNDGEYGDETAFAVSILQSAAHLPITGNMDSATAKALLEDNHTLADLRQYNAAHAGLGYLLGSIQRISDPAAPAKVPAYLYRLSFGAGTNIITQNPEEAIKVLNDQFQNSGINLIELHPVDFTPDKLTALSTSLEISSKLSPIDIKLTADDSGNIIFNAQPKKLTDDGTAPTQSIVDGISTYKKNITITGTDGKIVTIKMVSTSRDFIRDFIANLRAILQKIGLLQPGQSIGPLNADSNIADVVQGAIFLTQQSTGWTDQQVRRQFQVQLNGTQFVMLEGAIRLIRYG